MNKEISPKVPLRFMIPQAENTMKERKLQRSPGTAKEHKFNK